MILGLMIGAICGIAAIWQFARLYKQVNGEELAPVQLLIALVIYLVLITTAAGSLSIVLPAAAVVICAVAQFMNDGGRDAKRIIIIFSIPFSIFMILRAMRRIAGVGGKIGLMVTLLIVVLPVGLAFIKTDTKKSIRHQISPYNDHHPKSGGGTSGTTNHSTNRPTGGDETEGLKTHPDTVPRGLPIFDDEAHKASLPMVVITAAAAIIFVVLVVVARKGGAI